MSKAKEVIVVGGGLAGLCATLEAVALGARVTLLEKTKGIGGNSAKATSGINGTPTAYQASAGIEDGVEHFQKDTISSGDGLSDPRLVEVLVNSSKEAIEYLSSFGLNLSAISQCGGHSRPRTHREPDAPDGKPAPVGWDIIKTLGARVKEHQAVTLLTEARATRFLTSDGAVVGLEYEKEGEKKELRADAVVMCTGGFCCDRTEDSLLVEFAPQKSRMPTTNGPFAIGDGIRMGRAVGAQLIHMDKVQLHPTGFVDPNDPKNPVKFLGPEALRGSGGILLNPKGERFVNELGRRDHVTQKILEQFPGPEVEGGPLNPDAHATILLNDQAVALFGKHAWEFYFRVKKFGTTVSGAKGLAEHLKVPEQVVLQTLEDYNAAAASQKQDPFGKKTFPVTFKPDENFYLCTITPVLHYSMGGLRITQEAEVLGEGDKVIKGLYGAGEVTGGVHGENRLAGNSLLECVVFGRIAGRSAAKL